MQKYWGSYTRRWKTSNDVHTSFRANKYPAAPEYLLCATSPSLPTTGFQIGLSVPSAVSAGNIGSEVHCSSDVIESVEYRTHTGKSRSVCRQNLREVRVLLFFQHIRAADKNNGLWSRTHVAQSGDFLQNKLCIIRIRERGWLAKWFGEEGLDRSSVLLLNANYELCEVYIRGQENWICASSVTAVIQRDLSAGGGSISCQRVLASHFSKCVVAIRNIAAGVKLCFKYGNDDSFRIKTYIYSCCRQLSSFFHIENNFVPTKLHQHMSISSLHR